VGAAPGEEEGAADEGGVAKEEGKGRGHRGGREPGGIG